MDRQSERQGSKSTSSNCKSFIATEKPLIISINFVQHAIIKQLECLLQNQFNSSLKARNLIFPVYNFTKLRDFGDTLVHCFESKINLSRHDSSNTVKCIYNGKILLIKVAYWASYNMKLEILCKTQIWQVLAFHKDISLLGKVKYFFYRLLTKVLTSAGHYLPTFP